MKVYFRAMRDCIKTAPLHAGMAFLLLILSFVGDLEPVMSANMIQAAQDFVNTGASADMIWRYLFLMLALCFISGMTRMLMNPLYYVQQPKLLRAFEQKLFLKMFRIPQIYLEDAEILEKYKLASKAIQPVEAEHSLPGLFYCSINAISTIVSTAISIMILVAFSPKLLFFAVISTPLSMVISVKSEGMRKRLRRAQAQKTRETEYFWGLFCKKESVKEMRIFGSALFFRNKWLHKRDEMLNEDLAVESKILRYSNGGDIVKNLFYGMNIALAIILVIRGEISIGQFTACLAVFGSLQINLVSFMYLFEGFAESLHMAEEYYEFIDLEEKEDGSIECGGLTERIELDDVSFRYPCTDKYALKNICLTIKKGEHIVIVGENGSGKTTLSKLITACYEPEKGNIRIDGKSIKGFSKKSYLRNFTMVSQNFTRYNMSLRENITISDVKNTDDDIRLSNVIKAADISEISSMIGGADAQLGREFGGFELSGGQWQKIAIARGLFRDAPVIILDEPTAALDPLIEYEILTDFIDMTKDRTSVIISHRIGICVKADRIIVMKDGEIAETGSHEELLRSGGEYSRMWEAQAKWFAKTA